MRVYRSWRDKIGVYCRIPIVLYECRFHFLIDFLHANMPQRDNGNVCSLQLARVRPSAPAFLSDGPISFLAQIYLDASISYELSSL